jgi:hypothetical protein
MSHSLDLDDKRPVESSTNTTIEEQVISQPPLTQHEHQQDLEKQDQVVNEGGGPNLKLASTVTTESAIPPPSPDGGLHAWLKVFGGFFIYVNIWSVSHSTSPSPH